MPRSLLAKSLIFLACLAWRRDFTFRDGSSLRLLKRAESQASPAAARILATARRLTVDEKAVLPGACWDYVNLVWNKAGYGASKRRTVFKGSKKGPYADPSLIRPGDWLYFVNRSYHGKEHSSLFVAWADNGHKKGYLLSYAGEQRAEPARYKRYDLRQVYQVIRAAD